MHSLWNRYFKAEEWAQQYVNSVAKHTADAWKWELIYAIQWNNE